MDDKEKELAGTENSTDSTARGNGGSDEYEKSATSAAGRRARPAP